MRCVILAGGKGRRLGPLGKERPKILIEAGGRPLIWRLMDHASQHGISEFIIAAGHLGASVRAETEAPLIGDPLRDRDPAWRVEVVDTGDETGTGGRLKRIRPLLSDDETILLTYCDGLSDLDLTGLTAFHHSHGRLATVAAVQPPSPFGWLDLEGDLCTGFREKPARLDAWINAGYFVLNCRAIGLVCDDTTMWEREPVSELARAGELMAFRHYGYWRCIDTPNDLERVEQDIAAGVFPGRSAYA